MSVGRRLIAAVALVLVAGNPALSQELRLVSSTQLFRAGPEARAEAPLAQPARLTIENVPLAAALIELRYSSGVLLAFSPSLLPTDSVSCFCEALTVRDALDHLLIGTPFRYSEVGRQILLEPAPASSAVDLSALDGIRPVIRVGRDGGGEMHPLVRNEVQQEGTVTGQVVDASSLRPIGGAQIYIEGGDIGVLSRSDGRYLLQNVPAGTHTLRSEVIGYQSASQTITVVADQTVRADFELVSAAIALDEVVVTGTAGSQLRRAQGAQIADIDATEVALVAPVKTVGEMLQARIPGVSVQKGSGRPGLGQQIRIRGHSSISLSNQPLVFIDGIRADARMQTARPDDLGRYGDLAGQTRSRLDDLDPATIERIEVVKGPAAATLYGADASAGVIQIFTKSGRSGEFTQTISTELSTIKPNFIPLDTWAVCDQAAIQSGAQLCQGASPGTVISDNPILRNDVIRDGASQEIDWSGQGGGDGFTYYLAAGLSNGKGIWPTDSYKQRYAQANFDFQITENLTGKVRYGLHNTTATLGPGDHSGRGMLLASYMGNPLTVGEPLDGWLCIACKFENVARIDRKDETLRHTISANVVYDFSDWLTNRLTVGGDFTETEFFRFWPKNDEGWFGDNSESNRGRVRENRNKFANLTFDYLGNFTPSVLPEPWSSSASVGLQGIITPHELVWAQGTGLTSNGTPVVSAATEIIGGSWRQEERMLGYFGQLELGYDDRIFLQLGARVDQHSSFGEEAPAFVLPKIGLSYVLSDEPFWESSLPSWINTVRLRAAYGTTGRAPTAGAALATFAPGTYFDPYTNELGPGVIAANPGNPNLKAERGTEFEVGFDAGLFSNRLGVEFTFFNKVTSDLLLLRPIPPSEGFTESPWSNIGEVLNRGVEVALNAELLNTSDVVWSAGAAMNTLKNEIVDLGDVGAFTFGSNEFNYTMTEGYPVGSIFTHKVLRVEPENNRAIVTEEKEYLGSHVPTFQGSLRTTLTFLRSLRLYAQADWKTGYRIWDSVANWGERGFVRRREAVDPNFLSEAENLRRHGPYVTPSGEPVGVPQAAAGEFAQKGDFIRLREVTISYTLPAAITERMGLTSATLRLGGRNLGILTTYEGADPEAISNSATNQFLKYDFFATPTPRRWTAGLRVQF